MHETSAVDSKDRGTNLPKNIFCSGTTSGPLVVGLFLKPWVIYGSALGILWTYLLWIFYGSICFKPQETIPRTPTMRQTSSVVGLFLKPWIIYGSALGILCNLLWIFYGSICFKPQETIRRPPTMRQTSCDRRKPKADTRPDWLLFRPIGQRGIRMKVSESPAGAREPA